MIFPSPKRTISLVAILMLVVVSLSLGSCTSTDAGKKDDPVFFGGAGGGNGGAGATSGISLSF